MSQITLNRKALGFTTEMKAMKPENHIKFFPTKVIRDLLGDQLFWGGKNLFV